MNPLDASRIIIAIQPRETLARWWCLLNSWGWPKELPQWGNSDVRSQLMRYMEQRVSPKECSRYWNRDMTPEEFEDFWNGTHEGDLAANERYKASVAARAAKRAGKPFPQLD
jgi:hypothetical protein